MKNGCKNHLVTARELTGAKTQVVAEPIVGLCLTPPSPSLAETFRYCLLQVACITMLLCILFFVLIAVSNFLILTLRYD